MTNVFGSNTGARLKRVVISNNSTLSQKNGVRKLTSSVKSVTKSSYDTVVELLILSYHSKGF